MRRGKFETKRHNNYNQDTETNNEPLNITKSLLLYLHDLSYLFGIILLALLLFFRVVVVSGDSMNPTLIDSDYLLLLSTPLYHTPKNGDIVVASKESFKSGEPIIKRVIAVEGQTVDIDYYSGTVYVDGIALQEPYINNATTLDEGVAFPLVVDEGCVFVLGDNRDRSQDSRSPAIGLIDTREILGKAFFLFLPGQVGESDTRDFGRIGGLY